MELVSSLAVATRILSRISHTHNRPGSSLQYAHLAHLIAGAVGAAGGRASELPRQHWANFPRRKDRGTLGIGGYRQIHWRVRNQQLSGDLLRSPEVSGNRSACQEWWARLWALRTPVSMEVKAAQAAERGPYSPFWAQRLLDHSAEKSRRLIVFRELIATRALSRQPAPR